MLDWNLKNKNEIRFSKYVFNLFWTFIFHIPLSCFQGDESVSSIDVEATFRSFGVH